MVRTKTEIYDSIKEKKKRRKEIVFSPNFSYKNYSTDIVPEKQESYLLGWINALEWMCYEEEGKIL